MNELNHPLSLVTESMTGLMLLLFERALVKGVGHGLPQGALILPEAATIVAATPCMAPAFDRAMIEANEKEGASVVLVHHGFFPEILDEVHFSVVRDGQFSRHRLFLDRGRRPWLVAERGHTHYLLTREGLLASHADPFATPDGRSAGLCAAAKLIAALTLGREAA